ncbi:DUF3107 family protein [Kocuria rhizophila]|nr:DUF3107 family protein [Kocuria rhizophila]
MEIKIGVQNVARELVVHASDRRRGPAKVAEALSSGAPLVLQLQGRYSRGSGREHRLRGDRPGTKRKVGFTSLPLG